MVVVFKIFSAFLVLSLLTWLNSWWLVRGATALCDENPDWHAEVALVPSGDPGYRVQRAVRLLIEERVDQIVISGAGIGGDSADVLAVQAKQLLPGVPLVLERAARSTEENMRNVCVMDELTDVVSVAIVTDQHHTRRAVLTALKHCPRWQVCAVPIHTQISAKTHIVEATKLLYYQLSGNASFIASDPRKI